MVLIRLSFSYRFTNWYISGATSINEMTLSFVPKVIVVLIGIAFLGNFFMVGLSDYFSFIFDQISGVGL